MKLAGDLRVGDRFRPAHPAQKSANGKSMGGGRFYRVVKVFAQSPNYIVAIDESGLQGNYTLPPMSPVLLPGELEVTEEEVMTFVSPKTPAKCIVGYKLLWDGKADIDHVVTPTAAAYVKALYVMGRKEFAIASLSKIVSRESFELFLGRPAMRDPYQYFLTYRRDMIDVGILEEVLGNTITEGMRRANLI